MRRAICCLCFVIAACLTTQAQLDDWSVQHFQKAREAQKSNRLDIAVSEYRLVLSRHPEFAECYLNLGIVYSLQERYPQAITSFKTALKYKPHLIQARILLGITLYEVQEFHSALAELDLALAEDPTEKQAKIYRALTLRGLDRPEDAIAELRSLAILYPNDVTIMYQLGEAYREGALRSGHLLADKDPDSPLRDWALAISAEQEHNNNLAIVHYVRALAGDPNIPQMYQRLAFLFDAQQAPQLAQEVRDRFTIRTPDSRPFTAEERERLFGPRIKVAGQQDYVALWKKLGPIHPSAGLPLIADSPINRLVKERLQSEGSASFVTAVSLFEKGNYAEAAARLRGHVRSGQWIDAYVLARSLLAENDPNSAQEVLDRYLRAQYQMPSVALLKLEVQSQLAAQSYGAVLAKQPGSTEARILHARSLAAEDHIDEAIDEYRDILKSDPTLEEIHLAIGKLYLDQGLWSGAAAEFVQELKNSPDNSLALALLGHAYTEANEPDLAVPILERVLARFPKDAAALADYGKDLTQKGDKRGAIEAFESSLKEDGSEYRLHYLLFQLYRAEGQDKLAQSHLSIFQAEEAKAHEEFKLR